MTLHQFRLIIPRAQLLHVLTAGTFLAQRKKNQVGVTLCYLADGGRGYFAEVGIEEARAGQQTVVLRSFSGSVPLQEYARSVWLPEH